jgi:hypothetical protein
LTFAIIRYKVHSGIGAFVGLMGEQVPRPGVSFQFEIENNERLSRLSGQPISSIEVDRTYDQTIKFG